MNVAQQHYTWQSKGNCLAIVKVLLESGADIEAKDNRRNSLIMDAFSTQFKTDVLGGQYDFTYDHKPHNSNSF